ncbi:leucine-rich repeat protein [Mycoplasma sp. 1458C]|uniref:leucine-rich repeat domain-containing protein n=1 Tax=Mycoplasma sp. 1458C TaxID=3401661 RepID=UPI003AACA5B3
MKEASKDYEIINNKLYIYTENITLQEIQSWQINESEITELHSETLKSIDSCAFIKFANLRVLELPNVEEILDKVFAGVKALDRINMPKLMHVEDYSFNYHSLPAITIINEVLFKYQSNEKHVHLDNVKSVARKAFFKNKNIISVSIPDAVEIQMEAFAGCLNLESIDFPNLTFIGTGAFVGCYNLQNYNVPKLERIGWEVFTYDFLPDELILGKVLFKYQKNEANYQNDNITVVGGYAFRNNRYVKSIKLKNAIFIHENAFSGTVNLETLELNSYGNNYSRFDHCYLNLILGYNFSLKEIKISDKQDALNFYFNWEYVSMPDPAYINSTLVKCNSQDEIYKDKKATYVSRGAFANNYYVKEIHLENAISCAPAAFEYAYNLEQIHIPNWNPEYWEDRTFYLWLDTVLPVKKIEIPNFSHTICFPEPNEYLKWYKGDELVVGNSLIFYKGKEREYYNENILSFSGYFLNEATNLEKIHLPNLRGLKLSEYDDYSNITKLKEFITDIPSLEQEEAQSLGNQLMKIPSLEKFKINDKYSGVKIDDSWVINSKY